MKKNIPFFISIAILAILLGLYYSVGCVRGSGKVVAKDFDIEEFDSIELNLSSAILYIAQKESRGLRIEAEDNILERLKINVINKKLNISRSLRCLRYTEPVKIYASFPLLTSITVNGSAEVVGENKFVLDEMKININGSGEIILSLEVQKLETAVSGSGIIQLNGLANVHTFNVSGSGILEAYSLITNKSDITISGPGKAEVVAIEELNIKISGPGKVMYMGEPKNINQDISGSGSIKKVEEEVVVPKIGVDEKDLKMALISDHPEIDLKDAEIVIEDIDGAYVKGRISYSPISSVRYGFLAALTNEGWITILEGENLSSCEIVEKYNFPVAFISECYNEITKETVIRGQKEAIDIPDEDLLEQINNTGNVEPKDKQTVRFEAEPAEQE